MNLGTYSAPLECLYHPERKQWEVVQPFFFARPNGEIIKVPAGMLTDFASTGNIPFFPQDDVYDQAAVVHDFLYQGEFLPRPLMDQIFKEALTAIPQVPRWKIPVMWLAVRLFGGTTYTQHDMETRHTARALAKVPDNEKTPLWPDGVLRFV